MKFSLHSIMFAVTLCFSGLFLQSTAQETPIIFSENFEGDVFPSVGWVVFDSSQNTSNDYTWEQSLTYGINFSKAAYIVDDYVDGDNASDWLVTPLIKLGSLNNVLRFYQRQSYTSDFGSIYSIRISTGSQIAPSDFNIIEQWDETAFTTDLTLKEISLDAYKNLDVYIAFVMENNGGDTWVIDEIELVGDTATTNVVPVLITDAVTNITSTTAISGGNVISDGGTDIISRGICWDINENPTINTNKTLEGTGLGAFTSTITGLAPNTTYYVRAYAINSEGVAYGTQQQFNTLPEQEEEGVNENVLTDADGNTYNTILIGTQKWMAENLKVAKYRNGDEILYVPSNLSWSTSASGAWCDYNGDIVNDSIYGKLYNWYAVNDSRNICPVNWHVPSQAEWTVLLTTLGGAYVAGDILKDTMLWTTTINANPTNESGFSARPGGARNASTGAFSNIKNYAFFWTSEQYSTTDAYYRSIYYANDDVSSNNNNKKSGYSVRCLYSLPIVTLAPITDIGPRSAMSGGEVTSIGRANSIVTRGLCWSTSPNPTIENDKTVDIIKNIPGTFNSNILGLLPATTYYVRAYATNADGTAYSEQDTLITSVEEDMISVEFSNKTLYVYPVDNAANIQWGCYNMSILNARSRTDGALNTQEIVKAHDEKNDYYGNPTQCSSSNNGTVAAKICADLIAYGYDDWYLPAKDELDTLFINKDIIGGFISSDYWSSSEQYTNDAWDVSFATGFSNYTTKYLSKRVRCIRSIDESVNINKVKHNLFSIYPNPVKEELFISVSTGLLSVIEITNTLGQSVYSTFYNPSHTSFKINVSSLPSGIYFIKIGHEIQKFIKE